MRIADYRAWLPALALIAVACTPGHRPLGHRPSMAMACARDACAYKSKCFSDGAIHSSDGVCQTCSSGKWVAATGCHECPCHERGGKMSKSAPSGEHHHREPKQ
jgi:hypothetical protein